MLFTFVRASFGQDPLTAREFVTEVSKISTDFTSTKVALVRCKVCNARGGRIKLSDYGKSSHSLEAETEAVNRWNKRTQKGGI